MTTDRDRSIEGLLRRAVPADRAPRGDCPDAETLAALADGTLTAAVRRDVEAHVADCNRCQMVTAAMVRADAPAGTASAVTGEVPAWRRRALNWLVPAVAAATAVALWVLVPDQRTPLPEAPREEQKTAATSLPRSSEAPPTSQRVTEEPLRVPADSPAGAAAESAARSDMAQPGNAAALQGRAAGQANPAAAPPEERLAGAAAPAPPPPAAAPPPAPPPPAPAAPPPAAAPPLAAAMARRAEAAASFEVVSPNPRIRWRIGPGSLVQYSEDAGGTWTMQQTGVTANFTAGSAPAADVLWLAGPGGLVMRTTDAGRRWERTAFPEAVDLRAITATTALDATVDLADGRRLRTTDGGRTWAAVTP